MRRITRQDLANNVCLRWDRQYYSNNSSNWMDENKEEKSKKLHLLRDFPEPDEVDNVIGNPSWTRLKCDDCLTDQEEIIEMGEEIGYASDTASLCKECLNKAIKLFEGIQ